MTRAAKPGRPLAKPGGPVKRSLMIAGHATSVSLEPIFWDALARAARDEAVPLSALVARIDAARVMTPTPSNLASALRVWLFARALDQATPDPASDRADASRVQPASLPSTP